VTGIPAPLDERFRAAAAQSGDLDVAFDILDDTPIGSLLVGVSERGLCRVHFDPDPERELDDLARRFGPRVLRSPKAVDRAKLELDEYFSGRRRSEERRVGKECKA
jgi:methylated-DNA-[protein]-cysteine S-methyltransferase